MAFPLLPVLAILAAAGIGYAVTTGLVKDHMSPTDGNPEPGPAPGIDCIETLDKLPTGSSDIDNLRNAAKKAFLTASSPSDAMFLRTFAGELDAQAGASGMPKVYHDAATCMRGRAESIEKGMTINPAAPSTLPLALAPIAPPPMPSTAPSLAPSSPSGLTFPV